MRLVTSVLTRFLHGVFNSVLIGLAAIATALLLALSGCSESSEKMSVTDVFPPARSADNDPATQVWAKFSAAVRQRSLSPRTFSVVGSESGPMTGTFTLEQDDRMVIFVPDTQFADGETVTVTLRSGIKGKSGVSSRKRRFTFEITPAVVPPPAAVVTSLSPSRNATGVDPATSIAVEFDKTMDPFSFTESTVLVRGSVSGTVPVDITEIMDSGQRLVIVPRRPFLAGERVSVALGREISSADGVAFGGDTWTFLVAWSGVEDLQRGPDVIGPGKLVDLIGADIDADGRVDLVARTEDGESVLLFFATGKGEFGTTAELPVGQRVLSLAVVDLDDDGLLDVLAGGLDRVTIFLNATTEAGIAFAAGTEFATGSAVYSIAAGDIDHAGVHVPDLVLDTEAGLRVQLGGLDGPPAQIVGDTRASRTALVLRDLLGDGSLELVSGDLEGNTLSLRVFSHGEGFRTDGTLALASDAREVHVEDLDGNGEPEVVALVPDPTGAGEEIVFLPGTGEPGGVPQEPIALATLSPSSLALADADADGDVDILVTNPELAEITLYENVAGSFSLDPADATTLLSGEPVITSVVLDVTGDGAPDIVATAGDRLVTLLSELEPPPPPPMNHVGVSGTAAEPGTEGVRADVRIANESALDGYTIVVGFDPAVLEAVDIDTAGTATGDLEPEFTAPVLDNTAGIASFNAVFEFFPPFEGKVLAAGDERTLFRPVFNVRTDAPIGESALVIPAEPIGEPPLATVHSSGGESVPFTSSDGVFTVLEPPPPPPTNAISASPAEGEPGSLGVPVTVSIDNESALDEFTIVVGFDPVVVGAAAIEIDGTTAGDLAPDVTELEIDNIEGFVSVHVIFDDVEPLGERRLEPGSSQSLFRVLFDVLETAPEGVYAVTFPESVVASPSRTALIEGGAELLFTTTASTFTVVAPPPPPSNALSFESVEAKQADSGVPVGVLLSNESEVEAFTVFVGFPLEALDATDIGLSNTATEANNFEFRNVRFSDEGFIGIDVIFDFMPPFEGNSLAAGSEQVIFKTMFNVLENAPIGEHTLRILPTAGPDETLLISGGERVEYTSIDGVVTINQGTPPDNPNKLVIDDITVPPGVVEFPDTVFLTSVEPIDAVTVIGLYEPDAFEIVDYNIVGTVLEPIAPDFVVTRVEPDAAQPFFSYAAIFDAFPPFSDARLSPGTRMPLVRIILSVGDTVPDGEYDLKLENEIGEPPLANALVQKGFNIFPSITGGKVIVRAGLKPTFVRGDTNGSGRVDLADHIYLVNFVFRKGPRPPCMDAADVDDNGKIEVADMVRVLDYLFRATFVPPAPFPDLGTDPTDDELGCDAGVGLQ